MGGPAIRSTRRNLSRTTAPAPATPPSVHELYENALHRAPDAQGLANWTNALDHGVLDRAEVLIGFAQSLENLNNHSAAFQHGLILA